MTRSPDQPQIVYVVAHPDTATPRGVGGTGHMSGQWSGAAQRSGPESGPEYESAQRSGRDLNEFPRAAHAQILAQADRSRPYDPGQVHRDFPDRWRAYIRANFRNLSHVQQFIQRALETSDCGVAVIVRSAFLEGVTRHRELFDVTPPTDILQFSERVVMHKGKLSAKGSSATSYCWLVWDLARRNEDPRFHWIAPCRRALERPGDYGSEDNP